MITTAKDAVKLSNFKFEIPLYVVEIEMTLDDEAAFAEMLLVLFCWRPFFIAPVKGLHDEDVHQNT